MNTTADTTPSALHAHFLAILPRIQTHAEICFRGVKCPGKKADAIAETIAIAWKWFLRLNEQGKDPTEFVSTLADFAVRHVRAGRKLCGQEKAKDVLSTRGHLRHGFNVESLASSTQRSYESVHGEPHGQERMDALEDRLKDNTQSPVADQAAFRIDFPEWLAELGHRNRQIAQDMALDLDTQELAAMHKLSQGRISQLRRELHKDWRRFHGELA